MISKSWLTATSLVKATILSVAITWINLPLKVQAFTTSLIQNDLYFGRNINGDGTVSESQFQNFLNDVITPRFPDGLTVFDANGQYLIGTDLIKEPSKLVTIFFDNTQQNQASVGQIVGSYMQQFNQLGVLQVTNQGLEISFDASGDLFENSVIPKPIKADLFFGRNIGQNLGVSETDFQNFLNNVVTPLFPNGVTVFDGNGQYLDSTNTIIKEPSKVVEILLENTINNENSIGTIIQDYITDFQQESVLLSVNQDVTVKFDTNGSLFEKTPVPQLIQSNLLFSCNPLAFSCDSLSGNFETNFQTFLSNVITPLFPDGLTVFNTKEQYKDNANTIFTNAAKVVAIVFPNTQDKENALKTIIQQYDTNFKPTIGVPLFTTENIGVAFEPQVPVPEPSPIVGLLAFGLVGTVLNFKHKLKPSTSSKRVPQESPSTESMLLAA